MIIFGLFYLVLLHIINSNMGEGFEKITKIKYERLEETIKKIEMFNLSLKKFKEKDYHKNNSETIIKTNVEESKIQNVNENTLSVNNSFNNETKKFIPLKILTFSYFQTVILFLISCTFLIPIYIITNSMVVSANKLINIENYLFGKILISSASILKMKCDISECDVQNELEFSHFIDNNKLPQIVEGIKLFNEINIFYNENFLLNACKSAYSINSIQYNECMENEIIKSANNTEALFKLIDEIIDNIYKYKEINGNNPNYLLKSGNKVLFQNIYLFESDNFKNLELIFYTFIIQVSDNFAKICIISLSNYLKVKRNIILLLTIIFCIIIILYCLYIACCFVNQLIHLINVSRCILTIIPTIVINNTPDLENWIENKY